MAVPSVSSPGKKDFKTREPASDSSCSSLCLQRRKFVPDGNFSDLQMNVLKWGHKNNIFKKVEMNTDMPLVTWQLLLLSRIVIEQ